MKKSHFDEFTVQAFSSKLAIHLLFECTYSHTQINIKKTKQAKLYNKPQPN
jgi:hypothetical protein